MVSAGGGKIKNTTPNSSGFVSSFEIHGGRKGHDARIQYSNWKVKVVVGLSIVLVLIFLGVVFILEFTKATKVLKSVKTKRFVKMDDYYEESEDGETLQNDIHIIPERRSEESDRRANQHPNHRYLEMEPEGNIYKKIMKDLYDESGWSPKPFDVKTEEYLGSVRSIISKDKLKGTRSKFPNAYLKGSGASMRLKGVYGYVPRESDEDLSNNPNFYYSKEINNLMQNYSDNERDESSPVKKAFKSHGAPFQVPVKDVTIKEGPSTFWTNPRKPWFEERFKKKPLTILLDIYPMSGNDIYFKKETPKFSQGTKFPRHELRKPGDSHSTGKFLFPHERRNGIIMKLNLYPKEKKFSRRQNSIVGGEEALHSDDNKRAEEKTFGWFSGKKEKKQETKECSLLALKPQGKHVTAKWKNKNGEWIHAKHLSVKYLKKK